jgi:hypothetical protein
MGHFQTSSRVPARSVDPSTADIRRLHRHIDFVPTTDFFLQKKQSRRIPSRFATGSVPNNVLRDLAEIPGPLGDVGLAAVETPAAAAFPAAGVSSNCCNSAPAQWH